jgi:hypothetical protein
MAQANLIDLDETMAYEGPQENVNNTQITAEQLKQTSRPNNVPNWQTPWDSKTRIFQMSN